MLAGEDDATSEIIEELMNRGIHYDRLLFGQAGTISYHEG
jgi:hypothetical protein